MMHLTLDEQERTFLRNLVRQRLPEKTAAHSESVADYMEYLARKIEIPVGAAVQAGLLHDIAKALPDETLLEKAREWEIALTPSRLVKPNLLHGPVGAEWCRRKLDIRDEAVLEAIAWHTTGRPGLGKIGLALYLADFAESLRCHAEAEEARHVFEREGFLAAVRFTAARKLAYVRTRPPVDETTESFHAWLQEPEREKEL